MNAGNLAFYESDEVVAEYARVTDGLTPAEQVLVDRHVAVGSSVLDLGVGSGRTVGPLQRLAVRYVGVDCAPSMVALARGRHPGVDIRHGDAADLSDFADDTFDAAMFSYNGIDCLSSDEQRLRCLHECARVLRPGGVLIWSQHNPRLLVHVPPKVRRGMRARIGRCRGAAQSFGREVRRVATSVFWRGRGFIDDTVDRGAVYYMATRRRAIAEADDAGLEVVDVVPSTFPTRAPSPLVPWYYYAAVKRSSATSG